MVKKNLDNIDLIDYQYLLISSALITIWLMTDIFGLIEKNNLYKLYEAGLVHISESVTA